MKATHGSTALAAVIVAALLAAPALFAEPAYTGYSGAPGSNGTCAGSCHGSGGGTIVVSGFPTSYVAGQTYLVTVGASGLSNFNCSVRIGTGSTTAGTIAAGTNTAVYNVSGEPNGVHLATPDRDNGTFNWTAPDPAVGDVRLYFAGHQSGANGPNTELVLTAQGSGVAEGPRPTAPAAAFCVEPTVATVRLNLRIDSPLDRASVRIVDRTGRIRARFDLPAGVDQTVSWPLLDANGARLGPGVYYAALQSGSRRLVQKFAVR
jgi:hypothetical protein